MEFLLYLAGPIRGQSYAAATDWRAYVAGKMPPHIITLSPMRAKKFLEGLGAIEAQGSEHAIHTPQGVTARDRFDVRRCDVVYMNLLGMDEASYGSFIEIGWADAFGKPLILVTDNERIASHRMVQSIAGFIVPTLDEAINVAIAVLSPGV